MKDRLIIVGLDGVPFRVINQLSDEDVMPNFKALKKEGFFKQMRSSIPEISSVSWSSIITGKNPGTHGIYGFTELIPGTYSLSYPNFKQLKSAPFWKSDKKKYVIINVPSTYPADELNGFLVSGFVSLDLENAVFPKSYIKELKSMDYRIDVDSNKAHKSKELFLKELFETLKKRNQLYRRMWKEKDWDVFFYVITGTDRLGHFMFKAFEDKNHKFRQDFLKFFQEADDIIGEIREKMGKNDSLIILSDHGMEKIEYDVFLNRFLQEEGFLFLEKNKNKLNYNCIQEKTKAFALDPARIYLHWQNKYPQGKIKKQEEEEVINELIESFKNLKKDGRKVIKEILRKEEIYRGPCLDNAPDLVLLPNPGFNLRGSLHSEATFQKPDKVFEGHHTQEDAFLFVMSNKNIKVPEKPEVSDVVDIIKQMR